MKINGNENGFIKKTKIKELKEKSVSERNTPNSSSKSNDSEKVLFSSRAKDIQKAAKIISGMPDIRVKKVMEIREKIDKGEYHVSGEEIAGKMLKDLTLT